MILGHSIPQSFELEIKHAVILLMNRVYNSWYNYFVFTMLVNCACLDWLILIPKKLIINVQNKIIQICQAIYLLFFFFPFCLFESFCFGFVELLSQERLYCVMRIISGQKRSHELLNLLSYFRRLLREGTCFSCIIWFHFNLLPFNNWLLAKFGSSALLLLLGDFQHIYKQCLLECSHLCNCYSICWKSSTKCLSL